MYYVLFHPALTEESFQFHNLNFVASSRPVYIESCVCVVKDAVKCSFEYLCVVICLRVCLYSFTS